MGLGGRRFRGGDSKGAIRRQYLPTGLPAFSLLPPALSPAGKRAWRSPPIAGNTDLPQTLVLVSALAKAGGNDEFAGDGVEGFSRWAHA